MDHLLSLVLLSLGDLIHLMTLNSIDVQMTADMCPVAWASLTVLCRAPGRVSS